MYPQPAPPVDREIQGVLSSVEMRQGGWHRFSILEQGNQYPIKVDTKQPETVQQAMSLMGQPVAAAIREQEAAARPDGSHINPHNGKPWVNRYLNGIAPYGYAPGVQPVQGAPQPPQQQWQPAPVQQPQYQQQPAPPQPVQPAVQPGLMGMEKDVNIMRQCAAKVVSSSWQILPEEDRNVRGMIEYAEVWMAYFMHGPLRFGVQAFGDANRGPVEPVVMHTQNGPQAVVQPADAQQWYDPGNPRFIELNGTFPCPECGHTDQHMEGCPAALPA